MPRKPKTCVTLQRLVKLRDVMASAKKVRGGHVLDLGNGRVVFDISTWADSLNRKIGGCNTSACVAGTAGLIPEFQACGFKTTINSYSGFAGFKFGEQNDEYIFSTGRSVIANFAKLFGITELEAEGICMPTELNYPEAKYDKDGDLIVTPAMVVTKLDRIIDAQTKALERQEKKKAKAARPNRLQATR